MRYRALTAAVGILLLTLASVVAVTQLPAPQPIKRPIPTAPVNAIERGRLAYERYGCAICHGNDGNSGIKNLNSETEEKIPAVIFVKEGYTLGELREYILKGNPQIGKESQEGPAPPYRMPAGRSVMTREEAHDLAQYLFSLYRESDSMSWK